MEEMQKKGSFDQNLAVRLRFTPSSCETMKC